MHSTQRKTGDSELDVNDCSSVLAISYASKSLSVDSLDWIEVAIELEQDRRLFHLMHISTP